ncbi:hypothetical protein O3M35_010003 [Rhynocoris fuscipes]|uniref:Odorant receptor n=1 Tax=Rhynocoris fuscipes TaxID=488301 RepID=A0AAW1CXB7_9HEMI
MKFLDDLTSEDSDFAYNAAKEQYGLFTSFSCLYPNFQGTRNRILNSALFIIFSTLVITNSIALCLTLYLSLDDATVAMQTIHFIVMNLIAYTILFTFNYRRKNISRMHHLLGENQQFYDDDTIKSIDDFRLDLKKKTKIFNIALPVFISVTGMQVICLNPIVDYFSGELGKNIYSKNGVSMNLAIPCWTPFGSNNTFTFLLSMTLQAGDHFVIVSSIVTGNMILFSMSRQIISELTLLISAIKRLQERIKFKYLQLYGRPFNCNLNNKITDKRYHYCYSLCLKENIKHHQRIISLLRDMNITWEWSFFIFFCTSTFSMAMCGILLMFGDGKVTTNINAITMGVIEVFDVFFVCWCGKMMKDLGEELYLHLYETNWIDSTKESARTLLIIMSVSKKPLSLYFNSITRLPANLETFSNLMNTAYSYFNLLYAFIF